MQSLLKRGLADTAALWPDVRAGYHWVYRTAHICSNHDQREALTALRRRGGLLGAMTRHQSAAAPLAPALVHFQKVTRSYWPGLSPAIPCLSCPARIMLWNSFSGPIALMNGVRQGAKGFACLSPERSCLCDCCSRHSAAYLLCGRTRPQNVKAWQALRQARETRRQQRTLRRRFRRDPASYLAKLEADFLKLILPP